MDQFFADDTTKHIFKYLQNLDDRIQRIESKLQIENLPDDTLRLPKIFSKKKNNDDDSLEFQIGQFLFAKAGIVVLAIGIIFLLTFPYKNLPSYFPSLIGYVLVGVLFGLSAISKKSYEYISRYLFGSGLVLLFFTTMRLHFFAFDAVVNSVFVETTLLAIITVLHLWIALKRNSVYLTGIGLTLGYTTALISESPYAIFSSLLLLALFTIFLKVKNNWNGLFIYGITLTFITHTLWFFNNPLLGNELQANPTPESNVIFILLYALIFASGNLIKQKDNEEEKKLHVRVNTFLIAFLCYTLYLVITLTQYQNSLVFYHLLASVIFLGVSALFYVRIKSKYSTFFYAMLGYTALSVAIIAQFKQPDFFVWLSWQSLLVISTAIWFRSKIIIVANFIIYLIIFIAYLILAGKVSAVSLSYGIVALMSARILNWKKDRLELKTDYMRTAYLAAAFFIFLYALYHIVPKAYISLSWAGVAILYYLLSVLLKSYKYRWMALLTLSITILYIFIIGITDLEPVLRIISFLVLGIVLMVISIIYARTRAKKNIKTEKNQLINKST